MLSIFARLTNEVYNCTPCVSNSRDKNVSKNGIGYIIPFMLHSHPSPLLICVTDETYHIVIKTFIFEAELPLGYAENGDIQFHFILYVSWCQFCYLLSSYRCYVQKIILNCAFC
jgi:hypothetical protein